jgi:membrane protein required for colicin V production
LNWLDWFLIAILLFCAIGSARRGFSREIIRFAAAVFGLVLGMWFYGTAGSLFSRWVSSERVANLIGFLLILFAVLLCGSMLGWVINRFLRTIGLSFFDRLLGAVLGIVKGAVISVALITAFMAFGPVLDIAANNTSGSAASAVLHSRIAPWVMEASRFVVAMAPMELKSSFRKQYAGIKSALNQASGNGSQERDEGKF